MAGDWIARCKGLSRKPEVLRIARSTGLHRRLVAETLCEFWDWADDQTEDGWLEGLTVEQLPGLIPETTPEFWLAVVQVGWLSCDLNGLNVPKFARWMGKSAKKRLSKNIRQARWRAPGQLQDDVGALVDAAASQKAPTREPNRTEPGEANASPLPAQPAEGGQGDQILSDGAQTLSGSDVVRDAALTTSDKAGDGQKRRRRKPDELFDTVAEITASDPHVSGSHIGRVVGLLREAEPPYTAAEVHRFAEIWHSKGWPEPITLGSVVKYIGWVRGKVVEGEPPRPGGRAAKLNRRRVGNA